MLLLTRLVDFNCRLELRGMDGRRDVTDTITSYHIWTAGVMMAGICARFGKAGEFANLGERFALLLLRDSCWCRAVQWLSFHFVCRAE